MEPGKFMVCRKRFAILAAGREKFLSKSIRPTATLTKKIDCEFVAQLRGRFQRGPARAGITRGKQRGSLTGQ